MSANDRIAPLHSRKTLTVLLVCGVGCLGVSCGKTQAYSPVDMGTVMQAVRSYGHGHQTAEAVTAGKAKAGAPESSAETTEDSTSWRWKRRRRAPQTPYTPATYCRWPSFTKR